MERTPRARLDPEELARYRSDGYVVPAHRLPPEDISRLQKLSAELIERNPHLENQPIAPAHTVSSRASGIENDGALMEFAAHPAILDMVEQIAGPDLILWTTTLFHKPADVGNPTPWHQDGEFWPIRPLSTTSAWIAVTESRAENGCLRVVPGTHRRLFPHVNLELDGIPFTRTIAPELLDEAASVDVELVPGQMAIFDVRIVHGARRNLASRPRTGFVTRFMPATSTFDHDGSRQPGAETGPFSERPLFLVRGRDRAGNDLDRNVDGQVPPQR